MGDTIVGVQFGISNPDDILKRSVVEVTTDKTYQSNQPVPNGVFDARFGVIENGKVCPTCKQTNQFCPGHFGHIRLARPVYLYQFFETVEKLAGCICLNCSKPFVGSDKKTQEAIQSLSSTGMNRFKEFRDLIAGKKENLCTHCSTVVFRKVSKVPDTTATLEGTLASDDDGPATTVVLQPELVLRAFQRITDEDCTFLGLNPKFARPEWMICTVLAVPPLTVRPSVVMDDNQRMEDDLTHKLIDIVRSNTKLRERIDKGDSAELIDNFTIKLQHDVATYVDNDIKGMPPAQQRSGRPLRTLKSRFGSKTGRVRGNLMGKRVDFSARSVITPDANIAVDELGVPLEIATNLTFPEVVNNYNRERLLGYVKNGPDKHPGAKSVHFKQDNRTVSLRYVAPDTIDLREGDVVHRHLIDGDIVLFNRQPTLHRGSMEAHRVRVLPGSTFRLNVSATRPYNADFDGDEMNMHVPQSISAATELRLLATVLRNIISPRMASPIIQLFQDTMTGVFRISKPGVVVPESIAMNMLARIKRPFVRKNRDWTGAEVISAALPLMNFTSSITIQNGELTKGILNKGAFGKASSGLVHVIFNDFGPERAGQLINEIQAIVTQFNLYTGFSVGTSDLIANEETRAFVSDRLREAREAVSMILSQVHAGQFPNVSGMTDGEELEEKISGALKEVASKINDEAVRSLPETNRIIQMVNSGSKGGPQNITQMVALLGQQLIEGKRVQYTLQDRTLPHFARYDDGIESRGFVEHSFVDGLMPAEFFFHAQAGREGLIDTAVKTSDTGYIQRRIMKTMEDQHVEYDGTVRNVLGSIVQFRYGEDGVDTVNVEEQPCNLATMTLEDMYREFALSKSDLEPFVSADMSEYPDLVDDLIADREMLVKSAFRYRNNDTLQAPVHLKRLLDKYTNPYSTKTDLTPAYVVGALGELVKEFPGNKVFHALLRFYLAPKKSIVVRRLTQKMFDEIINDIRFRYIQAQVHAGEMVGVVAAQSIGEPTTQLTLNTFHSAGTAKANATSGVPRIEELLSASKKPKRPSNVVYLREDLASSRPEAIKKVHEIQKTTLRDIAKSVRIYFDPNPTATTVADDRELLEAYRLFSLQDPVACESPWVMRLELNDREMAARDVLDMGRIQAEINKSGATCLHGDPAASKLVLRVVFRNITDPLQLRMMEDKVLDTVLTGVDGIGRVHIRSVKNEMFYNSATGGYAPKEQFVLDVEGTNLYDLMLVDGVDGSKTFSNDVHEVMEVFGIEAARLALYEEFNEVFATEKVNYHHLALLVDSMTYGGRIVPVNRSGMKKNEIGVLAKSSFEETSTTMFNAAMWGEMDPIRGVSANIMFGQKPPCGTGFVDILVDETRLPDGVEMEVEEAPLTRVEQRLQAIAPSDCRMEDILMDW